MSNKYEDLIKNARVNAECGEHMSPEEVTTLLNVVETTFAALAAENAWLKGTLSAVIDRSNEPDYQSIGMGCGVEDNGLQTDGYNACEYGWLEAMDRIYSEVIPDTIPETPATDAFLAEVRAQGVEMFAVHKRERQQALRSRSMRMSEEAAGMAADAENFAAQLRKGVQQ
jgi:hypothetical protein